jgi:hypothetical protein
MTQIGKSGPALEASRRLIMHGASRFERTHARILNSTPFTSTLSMVLCLYLSNFFLGLYVAATIGSTKQVMAKAENTMKVNVWLFRTWEMR